MYRRRVTHQALELLTRYVDVDPVDRVRLPAPALAVAARPVVTWSKRAGSSPLAWIIQENADLVETQEPPCGINVVFTTF